MDFVSSQLKSVRVSNGLSQNEVAAALRISRQSVSKWENGRTYPDIDNLILLSDLYETSVDNLVKSHEELQQ
ncbi:helix-turn-helix domain-containing protein [Lentilactobacillus kisonensis]|uniref:helix-turn-helix domain-containing protein n=1 Tax=Lentilactobacillus kisonensis TaxID=481722 RepID=UPI00058E291A|nr:helix-turn-helix transcriptional regulator [Lentilactobacillus kisonensis]